MSKRRTWDGTVTAQERSQAVSPERIDPFQALVQNSYDIIIAIDPGGSRNYVSPSVERHMGYTPAELLKGSAFDLLHPDDVATLRDAITACQNGARRTAPIELRFQHRDGSWRDFETVGLNLLDVPGVNGVVFNSRCIPARKETEAALRVSEARFRSMFEGAGVAMALVDRGGTILVANPALDALLGYGVEELVGMTNEEITYPADGGAQDELRRQLWSGEIAQYQLEKRYLHKHGDIVWGLLHTTPIRDERGQIVAALGQIQNITARKAAESALQESEERFRSAFGHAPIGLAIVTPDGRFHQVNRALCDLVGYSEDELLHKDFQAITHPGDLDDDHAQLQRVWSGEIDTYQLEKRLLHKDGHAVWVQMTVSAVSDSAGPRHVIAQMQDISAQRHLDMERATLLASEREYTRQLRELTEMRTDLTGMVAHELRSPIAALRMMTSMIATGELDPAAAAAAFASMHGQIDQLDRLVSDVAASAEAEREHFAMQFHPVPLAVLIDGAAAFALTALTRHAFSVDEPPDVRVWCDPERISQVLRNLLDNAAKHTPPDTPVALRTSRQQNRIRIEVANGGPGIAPEDLALIFEKFGRGRDAAQRKTAGAGLGLYLSRRIVEAHGAELTMASTPAWGAVFGFDLKVVS